MAKKKLQDMTLREFLDHPNATKLAEELREQRYIQERKAREQREQHEREERAIERKQYEEFCLKLVQSGSVKGRIPSFREWAG